MLFITRPEAAFRPTGDLDLLGAGDPKPDAIAALFADIYGIEAPEDALVFDAATLRVEIKREDQKYQVRPLTAVRKTQVSRPSSVKPALPRADLNVRGSGTVSRNQRRKLAGRMRVGRYFVLLACQIYDLGVSDNQPHNIA